MFLFFDYIGFRNKGVLKNINIEYCFNIKIYTAMGFVLNLNAFMALKLQFQTERKTLTTSKRRKDKTNRFVKKSGPRETDKLKYILIGNKEIIGE